MSHRDNDSHDPHREQLLPLVDVARGTDDKLRTANRELTAQIETLRRDGVELRDLVEGTEIGALFLDRALRVRSYTQTIIAIFALGQGDHGRPIGEVAHRLEEVDLLFELGRALEQGIALERPVRQRTGKHSYLMRILPYRTSEGAIEGVLITFVDVTAMVAVEEQQRLLVAELNHRVRNMLQVVIGLAHQTLRRSQSLQDFEPAFMGRMQALGRAYELLSRDSWSNVPMAQLLATQLDPFAIEGRRYTGVGEQVVIASSAALSLGLILYELATNATKYGALSTAGGKVDVSWQLTDGGNDKEEFVLLWQESGGPPVLPPGRSGFGTELVQRQLHYELNGTASMDFEPDGLRVTLAIPAKHVVVESRS